MPDQKRITYVPKEIEVLADQVGSFIQYWGFKKIHGQIWTHVWLAQKPIDATTLVKRLQVSKALVSLAIKDLLQYDVIRVLGQGDRRKILLVPNEDVQTVISNVLRLRETKMLGEITESQEALSSASDELKSKIDLNQERLEQMKLMTQMAQMALSALITSNLDIDKIEF